MADKTRADVEEWLSNNYPDEDVLIADGLDAAFIGLAHRAANAHPVAAYRFQKVIEIFEERDGMTRDEAFEFFDYNVIGAYVGDGTPVFVEAMDE